MEGCYLSFHTRCNQVIRPPVFFLTNYSPTNNETWVASWRNLPAAVHIFCIVDAMILWPWWRLLSESVLTTVNHVARPARAGLRLFWFVVTWSSAFFKLSNPWTHFQHIYDSIASCLLQLTMNFNRCHTTQMLKTNDRQKRRHFKYRKQFSLSLLLRQGSPFNLISCSFLFEVF
jgi:hypothetical protein